MLTWLAMATCDKALQQRPEDIRIEQRIDLVQHQAQSAAMPQRLREKQTGEKKEQRNVECIERIPGKPEGLRVKGNSGRSRAVNNMSEDDEDDAQSLGLIDPLQTVYRMSRASPFGRPEGAGSQLGSCQNRASVSEVVYGEGAILPAVLIAVRRRRSTIRVTPQDPSIMSTGCIVASNSTV